LGQGWREDSSNRDPAFTRNRIRHELLPLLEGWNPRLREHLAQMAELARDEEAWWQAEMARLGPQVLILAGRPVRGGGRAPGTGAGVDVVRLAALAPALQRRFCGMRRSSWARRWILPRRRRCATLALKAGRARGGSWPRDCAPSELRASCG
jgi:hypothetical protein